MLSLLASPPFQGRRPVFVGDDLTDEHGFKAVVTATAASACWSAGARPSAARYALHDPAAVRAWLDDAIAITAIEQETG